MSAKQLKIQATIPTAMLRVAKITAVLLVCLSLSGGHWLALQTVAWTRMLVDYSKNQSIAAAVADTFSGERPCEMCVSIEKGKTAEQKEEATTSALAKIEAALVGDTMLVIPARRDGFELSAFFHWNSLLLTPPTPPPKSLNA